MTECPIDELTIRERKRLCHLVQKEIVEESERFNPCFKKYIEKYKKYMVERIETLEKLSVSDKEHKDDIEATTRHITVSNKIGDRDAK